MAKKNTVRVVRRPLTTAEAEQLKRSKAEVEAQADDYRAKGRALRDASEGGLLDAVRLLREERDRQGVSLADIQERCGITRSQLSNLENATEPNPTLSTIHRIADALGVDFAIRIRRKPAKAE